MQRFLVCTIRNKNSESAQPCRIEAVRIKNASSPEDVTTPLDTVCFFFAEAESIEQLYMDSPIFCDASHVSSFVSFGKNVKITSPIYIYGKVVRHKKTGKYFVLNKDLKALIPLEGMPFSVILKP